VSRCEHRHTRSSYLAAISQLRFDSEGRAYHDKKRAEGKSTKEAIRCLKRKISDAVYRRSAT